MGVGSWFCSFPANSETAVRTISKFRRGLDLEFPGLLPGLVVFSFPDFFPVFHEIVCVPSVDGGRYGDLPDEDALSVCHTIVGFSGIVRRDIHGFRVVGGGHAVLVGQAEMFDRVAFDSGDEAIQAAPISCGFVVFPADSFQVHIIPCAARSDCLFQVGCHGMQDLIG